MRRFALLAAFLVGACAGTDALDARMKPMVGADEPALLFAMGRTPDATSEPARGVKLLQWRWQRAYAIPDRMLGYSYAGGSGAALNGQERPPLTAAAVSPPAIATFPATSVEVLNTALLPRT